MEKLKARIEAVLFTTGKALQTSEIAEILGKEESIARIKKGIELLSK